MKIYLREFEVAPDGAEVKVGRQGGRSFEVEGRETYEAWFKARPGVVKAFGAQPVVETAPAVEVEAADTEAVDELAVKREARNKAERDRRAAKKAREANAVG